MNNSKLAFFTIVSLSLLLILHRFGIANHLYLNVWYYDIIAHFLGGICLALSSLYILKNTKYIIIITFVLGIAWELYEIYFSLTGHPVGSMEYGLDTVKDLIVDIFGACTVWLIIRRGQENNKEK